MIERNTMTNGVLTTIFCMSIYSENKRNRNEKRRRKTLNMIHKEQKQSSALFEIKIS